jgi:hypothetical protein
MNMLPRRDPPPGRYRVRTDSRPWRVYRQRKIRQASASGHQGDQSVRGDLANPVKIRDEQVARWVNRHPNRRVAASTRHGGDDAIGGNLANALVRKFGDENVVGTVYCHAKGQVQLRACGWTAVSRVASRTCAGKCSDDTARRNLADTMISGVRDEEVAPAIHSSGPAEIGARWLPVRHPRKPKWLAAHSLLPWR